MSATNTTSSHDRVNALAFAKIGPLKKDNQKRWFTAAERTVGPYGRTLLKGAVRPDKEAEQEKWDKMNDHILMMVIAFGGEEAAAAVEEQTDGGEAWKVLKVKYGGEDFAVGTDALREMLEMGWDETGKWEDQQAKLEELRRVYNSTAKDDTDKISDKLFRDIIIIRTPASVQKLLIATLSPTTTLDTVLRQISQLTRSSDTSADTTAGAFFGRHTSSARSLPAHLTARPFGPTAKIVGADKWPHGFKKRDGEFAAPIGHCHACFQDGHRSHECTASPSEAAAGKSGALAREGIKTNARAFLAREYGDATESTSDSAITMFAQLSVEEESSREEPPMESWGW